MTDLENVKQSLKALEYCPITSIYTYFSSAVNLFRFLPKAEKKECAQSFYQWARDNAEENPVKFGFAELLLGLNDHLNDEHESALSSFIKARKHFEEKNYPEGVGLCAILTGSIYRTFGNFDLALKTLWEGYNLVKLTNHNWIFLSGCTNSIANINLEMHNYDEAQKMFAATYEESEKMDDYYFMIYALHGLGKVNMQQNKYTEAKEFFEKALQLGEKNKSPLGKIGRAHV